MELRRFTSQLRSPDLVEALRRPEEFETTALGLELDLERFCQTLDRLIRDHPNPFPEQRAGWDEPLSMELHQCLTGLSRRQATAMGMWHWLCVSQFPHLVWRRWTGRVPDDLAQALKPALVGRFLGNTTLNGVSRNTLARLWWCAETLWSEDDQYELVHLVFRRQDLFQAVFDREFGLYPPAARACVGVLHEANEQQWRNATRRLNNILTTTVLETLNEGDIRSILLGN